MNARESENYLYCDRQVQEIHYLEISRSSSASKSVEIFWTEIYREDFF
jgi:hypothetical protein